jgi:hypothetical protein
MLNKQYVFNINTNKFYNIIDKFKELNYIGSNRVEADTSPFDFSYGMGSSFGDIYAYKKVLNLYTWKIRRDKRIKSLILLLKLMEV